jgi:hypothetical protein
MANSMTSDDTTLTKEIDAVLSALANPSNGEEKEGWTDARRQQVVNDLNEIRQDVELHNLANSRFKGANFAVHLDHMGIEDGRLSNMICKLGLMLLDRWDRL